MAASEAGGVKTDPAAGDIIRAVKQEAGESTDVEMEESGQVFEQDGCVSRRGFLPRGAQNQLCVVGTQIVTA